MGKPIDPFSDPEAVTRSIEGPPRIVGHDSMQRMPTLLLAERIQKDAGVLIFGAGGGLTV